MAGDKSRVTTGCFGRSPSSGSTRSSAAIGSGPGRVVMRGLVIGARPLSKYPSPLARRRQAPHPSRCAAPWPPWTKPSQVTPSTHFSVLRHNYPKKPSPYNTSRDLSQVQDLGRPRRTSIAAYSAIYGVISNGRKFSTCSATEVTASGTETVCPEGARLSPQGGSRPQSERWAVRALMWLTLPQLRATMAGGRTAPRSPPNPAPLALRRRLPSCGCSGGSEPRLGVQMDRSGHFANPVIARTG